MTGAMKLGPSEQCEFCKRHWDEVKDGLAWEHAMPEECDVCREESTSFYVAHGAQAEHVNGLIQFNEAKLDHFWLCDECAQGLSDSEATFEVVTADEWFDAVEPGDLGIVAGTALDVITAIVEAEVDNAASDGYALDYDDAVSLLVGWRDEINAEGGAA